MKRILAGSFFLLLAAASTVAAADEPQILVVNGKLSIQAVSVTLSQFLRSLDAATGMNSKVVASELANQKMSVRLTGLDLDAAIRKSFQGLPFNYFYVPGKGITVIDRASAVAPPTGGISSSPVQSFVNDIRNDNVPPPPLPTALPAAQPGPAPAASGGNSANPATAPGGLAPAQGGTPSPTPTFQPIGGALSVPLPSATPAR